MARGYLNRPELTAEKFIHNPFSDDPQARLYKTGDLVRFAPDGTLEFLGRVDHQVKIRGFRVELGEIEAKLNQHPSVKQSVVIVREDVPGNKSLVAYLIANVDETQSVTNQLRTFIREDLPEYMVPSAYVYLDTFPLTPNKKIDRKALPAPDQNRPDLEESFVPPRDEMEEAIADVMADILSLDRIGIYDNFFDLGGHSLLATRLVSRLRQEFNIDLPLQILFEMPTVAQLSVVIEEIILAEIEELSDDEAELMTVTSELNV